MNSENKTFPSQIFFILFLLIAVFSVNSFSQNTTQAKSFSTVASASGKVEAARPKLIVGEKDTEIKNLTEDKKSEPIPVAALVANASLISKLERKAFDILNEKRKENGLPPVEWSDDMSKIARLHSENMAKFKFFSHVGLDGKMVNDRADQLGVSRWRAIGENIAYNHGYENPVEFACQRWMQSQAHRENILNPRWKEAGVGVALTEEGTYYFTEVFVLR